MKKLFLSGLAILGFAALPTVVRAQESKLPQGYTLSPTPISGKHCYYHGGDHANYYCYNQKLGGSAMQSNTNSSGSSMQPNSTDNSGSSMQSSPSNNSGSSMQSSPSNNSGSSMQRPNSTNSGSSNPGSAQKTPSNSAKPGNVINSPRSQQGGSGSK